MGRLSYVLLTLSLIAGCNSPADETVPETELPLSVHGQLMITETPELFVSEELPNGFSFTQQTFTGEYVSAEQPPMDLGGSYEGIIWTVYRPGETPGPNSIAHQFLLADVNSGKRGSAIIAGQRSPDRGDSNMNIWQVVGTGQYRGTDIRGTWSLDGTDIESATAHSVTLDLEITPNSKDSYVSTTLHDGSAGSSSAGGGQVFESNIIALWFDKTDFFLNRELGEGLMLNRHGTEMRYVATDPDHPFDGMLCRSAYFVAYKPDEARGPETVPNTIHSSNFSLNVDKDSDIVLVVAEYSPANGDSGGRFRSVAGTGKFDGAIVTGSWEYSWPEGVKPLDDLQGAGGQAVFFTRVELTP